MAPTEHASPSADGAADPAVGPAGNQGLAVHSDIRCPWARVGVHRLLSAAEQRGVEGELVIDHRWFPLGDEATPEDPGELDRKLAPVAALEPELGWATWADADHAFPRSSRTAAAWVQAAKAVSPQASVHLDRALRQALFADAADIGDDAVVERIAGTVPGLDVDEVRAELASGRPDAELDQQSEAASSERIPASPTIVAADGTAWTNPGIEMEVGDDGVPQVLHDDASVHDQIIDAFLATKHYD